MSLNRTEILPEARIPDTAELQERGQELARTWRVEPGAFLKATGAGSEAAYKQAAAAEGRIMQHAQIGFRDFQRSCDAYAEIFEDCAAQDVTVDRYGITLDWSMGQIRDKRDQAQRGTGLILGDVEDFAKFTSRAPVAPHFGDFVLGFPASVENTQAALAAGSTSIGNLGQYFTFRLPGEDDDFTATEATVTALALIATQDVDVLVHSNLDDGYAALFTDLASSLGAALLERYIVEELLGATISHCYGHHFTDPVRRLAFHFALAEVGTAPGTMIYGNTVSYSGSAAQNYASLASYLLADVHGQRAAPSGHAVNPVPVTENSRIPDTDEIIDAQLFAGRLIKQSEAAMALMDLETPRELAEEIVRGGRIFFDNTLEGLTRAGIDTADAAEMLLALRRLGGKRLEELFGAGTQDETKLRGRDPVVPSPLVEELAETAEAHLARVFPSARAQLAIMGPSVLVATTDVHEHGKMLLESALRDLAVKNLDAQQNQAKQSLIWSCPLSVWSRNKIILKGTSV
ncbi:MAG: hypothetical protein AAF441_27085, partial [Pseudomonadota bacterium]